MKCQLAASLIVAFASVLQAEVEAETLTLARDGRPNALIVLKNEPSVAARNTAGILADHLKQVCGGEFGIVTEAALGDLHVVDQKIVASAKPPVENFILIGESKLALSLGATVDGLGPGGVLIRTLPNALVLLGPSKTTPSDQSGTRYAVTTFLEDSLGCRFLWPGELGKVVHETCDDRN